jgi:hypothetical protein
MHAEQSVVFTGANRHLNFWRMNARQGGGVSEVKFIVDGATVHTDSTIALPAETDWVSQSQPVDRPQRLCRWPGAYGPHPVRPQRYRPGCELLPRRRDAGLRGGSGRPPQPGARHGIGAEAALTTA